MLAQLLDPVSEYLQNNEETDMAHEELTDGYIVDHWWTVKQAAEETNLTESNIRKRCAGGQFEARKVGKQWYVNPSQVIRHQKYQHRQPYDIKRDE